jgi:hypothetical protein
MKLFIIICLCIWATGCSSKTVRIKEETLGIQTFSPKPVDMQKIDEKNYDEIKAVVNEAFAPETNEFDDVRFDKEQGMFLYFLTYSNVSNACYRVTVDRNRSKVVSIRPDCVMEE